MWIKCGGGHTSNSLTLDINAIAVPPPLSTLGKDLPGPDLVRGALSSVVVPFLYGTLLAIGVTLLAAVLFIIIRKRSERGQCLTECWELGQS